MKFATISLSTFLFGYAKAQNNPGFWNGQGTPDGLVPGVGGSKFFSLCDKYDGQAKALCNRYCYAQDCYSPDITVVPTAVCNKVYADLVALTGEEPACAKECPCFDASTFASGEFYCASFVEGYLFLSNEPDLTVTGTIIGIANTVDRPNCVLAIDPDGDENFEITAPAVSQTQADTCFSILEETGCLPFPTSAPTSEPI